MKNDKTKESKIPYAIKKTKLKGETVLSKMNKKLLELLSKL